MLIIGERINGARRHIRDAISDRNAEFIKNEAVSQQDAGADYIDVNAGGLSGDEAENLAWVVDVVQEAVETPLCIDSADPKVLERVAPLVSRFSLLNSFSLESERLEPVLSIAAQYGMGVIGLCKAFSKMSRKAEEKVELASLLVQKAEDACIAGENIFIDPLVFSLGTDADSAVQTLEAIFLIRKQFPDVHITCGLSNVSYGLPNRSLINRTFMTAAMAKGLDSAIVDPLDRELMKSVVTGALVMGNDPYCRGYLACYRKGMLD